MAWRSTWLVSYHCTIRTGPRVTYTGSLAAYHYCLPLTLKHVAVLGLLIAQFRFLQLLFQGSAARGYIHMNGLTLDVSSEFQ